MKYTYKKIFNIITIILLIILLAGEIISIVNVYIINNAHKENNKKVTNLEKRIEKIEQLTPENDTTNSSEYKDMITYLESEMTRHREFVESERQFLIWLIAAIAAVALAILGLVGLANKKEIEDTISKSITDFSQSDLERKLNYLLIEAEDSDSQYAKINYLKDAVERQKKIRETNIVIFRQEEQNPVLRDCKQLFNKQCHVIEHSADMITDAGDNLDIKTLLPDGKSIVVYEVHQKEYCMNKRGGDDDKKNSNDSKGPSNIVDTTNTDGEVKDDTSPKQTEQSYEYVKISKSCSEHNIYCILYVGAGNIKPISDTYTAMSKTGVSLYQYLNTLINI